MKPGADPGVWAASRARASHSPEAMGFGKWGGSP